jgi:predicted nucleic acid-binding protein
VQIAELAADPKARQGLCPDPEDDYLIALAQATGADYLVSGDKHLSDVTMPPSLSPRAFLEILGDNL